ncbi:saccharopine dehydrogenase-like oxidoreductase isoform X1 [Anticarsia gemmatalis]|uniref:saccharopine dehydrogenase-like oxidoreductase isoform X1 n=1 Tax=Anticarsia gemmatalis TaxID=129554 RepID=UPI003F758B69
MSWDRLDLVIFGATGFTGKQTVIHMMEFAEKYNIRSWGVAGRSDKKLAELMKEVGQKTGKKSAAHAVTVIIADINDEKSLKNMCSRCKVLVNCCGPYRLYGEPVVKAAVESKTHYVDISGEPQFMEKMQLKYNDMACEAGVYIISACGWDSIPSDMGVMFLKQNFEGTLNSVRSYMKSEIPPEAMAKAEGRGVINYGTWESLVHGVAHNNELPALRKKLYPEPLPSLKPKLCRQIMHKKDGDSEYYLPFLGADESVVFRTQHDLHFKDNERPIQFKIYFKSGGFFRTIMTIFAGAFFFIMAKMRCTRNLLLKYPKFFSMGRVTKEGPVDIVMNNTYFSFDMIGEGWEEGADIDKTKPNKRVMGKVSGVNPAYGATCVALLSSAIIILKESDKMPGTGGVMTTGMAFKDTTLINYLNENNLKYEIYKPINIV